MDYRLTDPVTSLNSGRICHSRSPIERKVGNLSPEPACRQPLPDLALSSCGITRTPCRRRRQGYPESILKTVASIAKRRGLRHIFAQSKPTDCAVRHCAASPRGIRVGNLYQGACDDEEAQH